MNLIEELGLEKCKAIVGGAPEWARAYNTNRKHYTSGSWFYGEVWLYDFRTAIAEHDALANKGTDNLSCLTDHCTDIRNHVSPNTKVIEG